MNLCQYNLCPCVKLDMSCLELADDSEGSTHSEIDLLIGSNYYWPKLTGEIRHDEDIPIAILT